MGIQKPGSTVDHMNRNHSQPPSQGPINTSAVTRRDRALRLRTRVLLSTVGSAVLAVGGLGVLAEHTYAGRASSSASSTTTSASTATSSASSSSSASSDTSSSNSGSTVSTLAPSSSSRGTTIVSGGS